MPFDYDLMPSIALFLAGLIGAGVLLRLFLEWRHSVAVAQARRIAARLRTPATTLAAVEDGSSAVEELIEFRDVRAVVTAVRELLDTDDAAVRSAAVEVLRETRALEHWSRQIRKASYRAKIRAIKALGEVGDERAIDELIEALGDDDPDVAAAAAQAIAVRDPDHAADRLADALGSPNRRLAETAAAALVQMGNEAADALIGQLESLREHLLPLLDSDPEADVRAAAAEALARADPESAADHLRRVARSDPDWFVRARTYSLLAEINAPGAMGFLLESLGQVEPDRPPSDDRDDLESIIEGSRRVVSAILSGLRLLGFTEDEAAAAEQNASSPGHAEQEEAEVVEALAALRAGDPKRRAEAARQVGATSRSVVEALRQALRDPHPIVRAEAARALGRAGSRHCLEELARCLQDPSEEVRLAASAAMRAVVTREVARELQE
jgi:HEAT repeat protein